MSDSGWHPSFLGALVFLLVTCGGFFLLIVWATGGWASVF